MIEIYNIYLCMVCPPVTDALGAKKGLRTK